jgi:integrase
MVAPNVYRDAIGYACVVSVGSGATRRSKEKRWPHGTDLGIIKRWRDETRRALRSKRPTLGDLAAGPGTLASAVTRYLPNIAALESRESRLCDLRAWEPAFFHRKRAGISSTELDAQLHDWRSSGVAASTCNHRRNALIQLWRTLDGQDAPNPAEHTTHFREDTGEPRDLEPSDLQAIVDAMPRSKSSAMFRVFVETGWAPARIRRLKPQHLRLDDAQAVLVSRRKGQGTDARAYPLTPQAVEALRDFVELCAWGGVSKEALYTVFQRAVARVNKERRAADLPLLPADIRPYDARHTFGTMAWKLTGDPQAVAELMDVSMDTVMRYIRGAVPDRLRVVTAAIAASRSTHRQE